MTPTPPPFGQVYALASGNALLVEWTWSAGELLLAATLLAVIGLVVLRWLHQLAQGKA